MQIKFKNSYSVIESLGKILYNVYATKNQLHKGGGCGNSMGKQDKLVDRLLKKPKDFTNQEAETLLARLGYEKDTKGKTSGSRLAFYKPETEAIFLLHLSHPQNTLKPYVINALITHLKEHGEI